MRLPRLALTRIVSTGPRDYADAVRHMVTSGKGRRTRLRQRSS
jgi:hypothetical protein